MSRIVETFTLPLTDTEILLGESIGETRRAKAIAKKRQPHNGAPTDNHRALEIDIQGALGEVAVDYVFRESAPDAVWHRWEEKIHNLPDFTIGSVRIDAKTPTRATDRLMVQEDDPADWAYLLVLPLGDHTYLLRGWQWGSVVKRLGPVLELQPGRPAHVFENRDLRPVGDLIAGALGKGIAA